MTRLALPYRQDCESQQLPKLYVVTLRDETETCAFPQTGSCTFPIGRDCSLILKALPQTQPTLQTHSILSRATLARLAPLSLHSTALRPPSALFTHQQPRRHTPLSQLNLTTRIFGTSSGDPICLLFWFHCCSSVPQSPGKHSQSSYYMPRPRYTPFHSIHYLFLQTCPYRTVAPSATSLRFVLFTTRVASVSVSYFSTPGLVILSCWPNGSCFQVPSQVSRRCSHSIMTPSTRDYCSICLCPRRPK